MNKPAMLLSGGRRDGSDILEATLALDEAGAAVQGLAPDAPGWGANSPANRCPGPGECRKRPAAAPAARPLMSGGIRKLVAAALENGLRRRLSAGGDGAERPPLAMPTALMVGRALGPVSRRLLVSPLRP